MLELVITAFLLGLIGGCIPGPVLAASFTEVLQSNFKKSLNIIFYALILETLVALISLLLLRSINLAIIYFKYISIIGSIILLWFSYSLWKIKGLNLESKIEFNLWKMFILVLSNGMLWIYWTTICVPMAIELESKIKFGSYFFVLLVETGWLISTCFIVFVFSKFKHILEKPKINKIIYKVFSLAFLYFAIKLAYDSISYIINFWKLR